jgi:hypothetical protein
MLSPLNGTFSRALSDNSLQFQPLVCLQILDHSPSRGSSKKQANKKKKKVQIIQVITSHSILRPRKRKKERKKEKKEKKVMSRFSSQRTERRFCNFSQDGFSAPVLRAAAFS